MSEATRARRIIFTLPFDLLRAIDELARDLSLTRSQLIRTALERFLAEQRRNRLRESLAAAYQEYARSSQAMSEEFFVAEQEVWDRYVPWEPAS